MENYSCSVWLQIAFLSEEKKHTDQLIVISFPGWLSMHQDA